MSVFAWLDRNQATRRCGKFAIVRLVVFERDGQPLADREGRIALVSGRDLRTGLRSLRWMTMTRIEVRVLKE